mmetsp:Transcript_12670/g.36448  ORF Transcript_12670/g.36448 Transcript_12670/m.36448 type:complete len:208 (-) Transcript_12670:474-1097(-)
MTCSTGPRKHATEMKKHVPIIAIRPLSTCSCVSLIRLLCTTTGFALSNFEDCILRTTNGTPPPASNSSAKRRSTPNSSQDSAHSVSPKMSPPMTVPKKLMPDLHLCLEVTSIFILKMKTVGSTMTSSSYSKRTSTLRAPWPMRVNIVDWYSLMSIEVVTVTDVDISVYSMPSRLRSRTIGSTTTSAASMSRFNKYPTPGLVGFTVMS